MHNDCLPEQANLKVLKEIAELLNEETDLDTLLSGALHKLLQVTGVNSGWIFMLDSSGRHTLAAEENVPPALSHNGCETLRSGGCWCVEGIREGKLTKAANIIECRRIEKVLDSQGGDTNGITHHATIPLQSGTEVFGILNVATPGKAEFRRDELALLESIALQIGSAIKRVRLTKKEQEIALVEERNRLARDLHDSVNQLLFSLTLTARAGFEMTDDHETQSTFKNIQELAQEALTEMRALIWQLRPNGLEKGLVQAIKAYGEMLGLHVDAKLAGLYSLPSVVEETLWRMGQEALNNTKKHSGQNVVKVLIQVRANEVELDIQDDGCGFVYEEQSIPTIGIQGMRERAELMGGEFEINSAPGKGTKIRIVLPF